MRYLTLFVALFVAASLPAQVNVRVATYNIKFLNAGVDGPRRDNLKSVITNLEATMQVEAFLNNNGDVITLIDGAGRTVQTVSYTSTQAKPQNRIQFTDV